MDFIELKWVHFFGYTSGTLCICGLFVVSVSMYSNPYKLGVIRRHFEKGCGEAGIERL